MISLGLSAVNQRKYSNLLVSSHHIEISLHLMDLNHRRISTLSPRFLGGQVNINDGAEVSRSATLQFLDPDRKMALDSFSPSDGAMYMDRMIQIYYNVYSPDRTVWFSVPIFCGPITKMDRDWAVVNIECMGKEILGLGEFWSPTTYAKGAKRVDVVRSLLYHIGETKFDFSSSNSRLSKNLALSSANKPWAVARSVARSANLQLFYDGRGVARLRPFPVYTRWTFSEGAGGTILNKPQIGYSMDSAINAVSVKGAVPKGKKTPITYRVTAPKGSPLYPLALGRNGKPRYLPVFIDDDSIDTVAEAREIANDRLALGLLQTVTAAFDILPVPHLEPRDPYVLKTSEATVSAILTEMTIPLVATEAASVGYLKRPKTSTTNIRRRR